MNGKPSIRPTAVVAQMAAEAVLSAGELITLIDGLEKLKNAAAALQARASVRLRRLREQEAIEQGRDPRRVAPSVAAEVGLARRESPHRAARLLGLATVLVRELPHTMTAFAAGEISEWRASLVARETACLSLDDRREVDAQLAERLPELSDRHIVAEARRLAYTLDPHSVVARVAQAEGDRRVTIRPAPDCMAQLTALLPVAQGVAVYAALNGAATSARAAGDARSKGQVMADSLVERVTGQASADAVPVEVHLVISDQALLDGAGTAATLIGYGAVPAGIARKLAALAARKDQLWLRRLYAAPRTGRLVAMERSRRLFPKGLRRLIEVRDQVCRTPWCGAPIRHADHIVPVHAGGATSAANGQGLCERCNQVKEFPGWNARPGPDGTVIIRTPTGSELESRSPKLPHEAEDDRRMHALRRLEGAIAS